MPNAPSAMRPGKTKSVHELGFSLNGAFNPDAFIPAFNWRFHFPNTGKIGQLSGLFMGFNIGPAVDFYGGRVRGRRGYFGGPYWDEDRFYRGIWGRAGFELRQRVREEGMDDVELDSEGRRRRNRRPPRCTRSRTGCRSRRSPRLRTRSSRRPRSR